MNIHGKQRGFLLTIGASAKISELCPDGDLARLEELFENDSYAKQITVTAKIIAELNKAYEMSKQFMEPGYVADPMTIDEIMTLQPNEFSRLSNEAVNAFKRDTKQTVEVAPPKKEHPATEMS